LALEGVARRSKGIKRILGDFLAHNIGAFIRGRHTAARHKLRFVTSLSADGDELSQWRAYSPGGGYALGFHKAALNIIAAEQHFELRQCSYSKENQQADATALAEAAIEQVINALATSPVEPRRAIEQIGASGLNFDEIPSLGPAHNFLIGEIEGRATTWKHHSFHVENEWRLVSKTHLPDGDGDPFAKTVTFRPGRTMLVPYVEIKLDNPSNKSKGLIDVFSHVNVGPCPEPELAKRTLHLLFDRYEFAQPKIDISNTPHRQW
jgi:hypothetical protein